MCWVRGPGLSTGPLKNNVELRKTSRPVRAWRNWSSSTLSMGVDISKRGEWLNRMPVLQRSLTDSIWCLLMKKVQCIKSQLS